ncbi:unnamed protein product [Bursaphelenchus okinawaensis]|uniref:RING-CH-type domain-containing protein n=1 Tax=Bursaphelenchus okinawaensis TaxID=465554 RepID=A0A811JW45_9BILA|nr:unnamed protein product [Bursaphelenchus okinawaensis]CAG9085796.1 unnamed protein product [Bursaphelenchus okinawaensis]
MIGATLNKENMTDMTKFYCSARSDLYMTPSSSTGSLNSLFCRICHMSNDELIRPCRCDGSIGHVHTQCLDRWVKLSECNHCQVCKTRYARSLPKLKPLAQWERPTWSLIVGVILIFLLLSYHIYALYHSCTSGAINTTHLIVYISMLTVDQVVLLGMLALYLSGQTVTVFTNRRGVSTGKKLTKAEEAVPKV